MLEIFTSCSEISNYIGIADDSHFYKAGTNDYFHCCPDTVTAPGQSHVACTKDQISISLLNDSKNLSAEVASGQTSSLNSMISPCYYHRPGCNAELHSQQVPTLSSQMFHWDNFITE